MTCSHAPVVWDKSQNDLLNKAQETCHVCASRGVSSWACLQTGCNFVGCPASAKDHSSEHFKAANHPVAVNLQTFRIWCYSCKEELKIPEYFTSLGMKKLKARKTPGINQAVRKTVGKRKKEEDDKIGHNRPPSSPTNHPAIDFTTLTSLRYAMESSDDLTMSGSHSGLTGLRNLGNTCYMNAALQSLSNCPHLTLYFIVLGSFKASEPKNTMTRSYRKFIMDMWGGSNSASVTPSAVNSTLRMINPSFRGHQQQDTQEFLRCLMDRLHEEMKYSIPLSQQPSTAIEAGDAKTVLPHPSGNIPKVVQMVTDDTVSMTISSSSEESFQSCHSRNGVTTGESLVERVESEPVIASGEYNQELVQLHSSGSPLSRSTSLPSMDKVIQQDEDRGEGLLRMRTISSRSVPTDQPAVFQTSLGAKQKNVGKMEYRSVVSDIFDGTLRSSVQCKTCYSISHTRETFQDLSLPIPGKDDAARLHGFPQSSLSLPMSSTPPNGPCANTEGYNMSLYKIWDWIKSWMWGPEVTLVDCLSAFFSADELKGENMYSCDKCKKLRNGVKYCRLLKLPEVLCIHLKRFRHEYLTSYSTKISSNVSFPLQGLDLSQYAAPDCTSRVRTYNLSSVIVHQGSAGGGHYISYCKNPLDGNWYEFDDQYVTQVNESTVSAVEGYVLFYSKVDATEVIRCREQVISLDVATKEPALMRFYVSLEWMIQFLSSAEPGPINNSYFLCPHGDVQPFVYGVIGDKVCCVSEQMWYLLYQQFGGGPAISHLQPCDTCIHEIQALRLRRETEHKMFLERSSEYNTSMNYISMTWFRKWKDFIQSDHEPPDEIDNNSIAVAKDGMITLKKDGDYGEITSEAWNYLFSQYGGGPVISRTVHQLSDAEVDVD